MKSLNRATLIGNLTRDPDLKKTNTGTSVCTLTVATNRSWTNSTGEKKSEAMFHRVIAWSKLADIISQISRKGSRIYIEGRITYRQFKDKEGNDRFITEIVADDFISLEKKKVDLNDFPDKTDLKVDDLNIPEPK